MLAPIVLQYVAWDIGIFTLDVQYNQVNSILHNRAVASYLRSARNYELIGRYSDLCLTCIWFDLYRSSAIVNVKPLRSSWRTKMNKKLAKRSIKSFENELRDSENKAKKVSR